jgi:hypothetical protein
VELRLRGVQPLSSREGEKHVRGVQTLPPREAETALCGVQIGTRGPAEFEANKREPESSPEIKLEPEVKQEPVPFTIRGYFGIGDEEGGD